VVNVPGATDRPFTSRLEPVTVLPASIVTDGLEIVMLPAPASIVPVVQDEPGVSVNPMENLKLIEASMVTLPPLVKRTVP
jgi:hypothetical protein